MNTTISSLLNLLISVPPQNRRAREQAMMIGAIRRPVGGQAAVHRDGADSGRGMARVPSQFVETYRPLRRLLLRLYDLRSLRSLDLPQADRLEPVESPRNGVPGQALPHLLGDGPERLPRGPEPGQFLIPLVGPDHLILSRPCQIAPGGPWFICRVHRVKPPIV